MRGSLTVAPGTTVLDGIIPAHAGLTVISLDLEMLAGDHPRACGAHNMGIFLLYIQQGSSPRMRGSQDLYAYRTELDGIIPAHAGLTFFIGPYDT